MCKERYNFLGFRMSLWNSSMQGIVASSKAHRLGWKPTSADTSSVFCTQAMNIGGTLRLTKSGRGCSRTMVYSPIGMPNRMRCRTSECGITR